MLAGVEKFFNFFIITRIESTLLLLHDSFIDPFEPRRRREDLSKRRFQKTVKRKPSNEYSLIGNNVFIYSWTAFFIQSSVINLPVRFRRKTYNVYKAYFHPVLKRLIVKSEDFKNCIYRDAIPMLHLF